MQPTPVVLCERVRSSSDIPTWKFWCPFCRSYHVHGGEPDHNGDIGHRVAHCHEPSSPFRNTGYSLRLPKKAT
jgi:hypothetical protein